MRRLVFAAFLTLTWLLPVGAGAQVVELPITPDPTDCTAEPIDIDRLVEDVASATPAPTGEATTIPTAEVARVADEVAAELVETLIGSVACTNANQPLRALAYFTEDYLLHRISDEPSVTLGHLQAAATREPAVAPVEDRVTITSLNPGSGNGDMAYLEVGTESGGEPSLASLRFVRIGDEWLIDDVSEAIID